MACATQEPFLSASAPDEGHVSRSNIITIIIKASRGQILIDAFALLFSTRWPRARPPLRVWATYKLDIRGDIHRKRAHTRVSHVYWVGLSDRVSHASCG